MTISRELIDTLLLPGMRALPDDELKKMDSDLSTFVLHERARKCVDDRLYEEYK